MRLPTVTTVFASPAFRARALAHAEFVDAERIRQLALDAAGAALAAQQGAGGRAQDVGFVAGRAFHAVAEHQPGQLFAVRHVRRRHQLGLGDSAVPRTCTPASTLVSLSCSPSGRLRTASTSIDGLSYGPLKVTTPRSIARRWP
jgi:hypothetical protein